ncbi:hypothetical protein FIBSPDRAFT_860248 [Athelia psychrophila]|uniref:Secreted protein n=1 Tax=Athelia psychrophila TaxID=1759441 RepID=A0A166KFN3_9AGAM|nr:hypothetical protein FIBSPDRAFT_860248 [Fibularhizoctonia sp. CBS 109695]
MTQTGALASSLCSILLHVILPHSAAVYAYPDHRGSRQMRAEILPIHILYYPAWRVSPIPLLSISDGTYCHLTASSRPDISQQGMNTVFVRFEFTLTNVHPTRADLVFL